MGRNFLYTFIFTLAATYATFYFVHTSHHRSPASLGSTTDEMQVRFASPDEIPADMSPYSYDYSNQLYNSAAYNNQRLLMAQQQLESMYQESQRTQLQAYSNSGQHRDTQTYLQRSMEEMKLRNQLWQIRSNRTHNFTMAYAEITPAMKRARKRANWYKRRANQLITEKRIIESRITALDQNDPQQAKLFKQYQRDLAIWNKRIAYVTGKAKMEEQQHNEMWSKLNHIRWQLANVNSDPYSIYSMPSLQMAALQTETLPTTEPVLDNNELNNGEAEIISEANPANISR